MPKKSMPAEGKSSAKQETSGGRRPSACSGFCRCCRWMRKHCVERDGNEIYRDVISRKLVAHTLDGARLKFWAAAHDLEKVCGLRRLKLWALKFCRQNADVMARGRERHSEAPKTL